MSVRSALCALKALLRGWRVRSARGALALPRTAALLAIVCSSQPATARADREPARAPTAPQADEASEQGVDDNGRSRGRSAAAVTTAEERAGAREPTSAALSRTPSVDAGASIPASDAATLGSEPPRAVAGASRPTMTRQRSVRPDSSAPSASAREPSVRQLLRMASEAARSLAPARLQELVRRARLAGLAPQLRFSAERGFDQDLTASSSAASDSTRAAIGDQLRFGAALTFDLDRLVFAPEEVRLLSVERWLAGDRRKLLTEVVRLYYQRRRLQREQAEAAAPDAELDDSIREVESLLDALTGGGFTAALSARPPP